MNAIPNPPAQAPPGAKEFLAAVANGVVPVFWVGIAIFIAGLVGARFAGHGSRPLIYAAMSGAGVAFVAGLLWVYATGSQ